MQFKTGHMTRPCAMKSPDLQSSLSSGGTEALRGSHLPECQTSETQSSCPLSSCACLSGPHTDQERIHVPGLMSSRNQEEIAVS
ncbi:small integral membrane protein 11 isoform X1 [Manis pentadactyla]|uniref:small integral membrane protein 11 isoform X1 n=1 Tax=Manis pentadactyla TaxID=143292 RepID=UPI00255C9C40|nr:small integral membrane protein 11 isoform X1 [Manis pentadactyla]